MATRIKTRFYANGSVTTEKIADAAINSDKIADNAVGTSKISDGAVTDVKLAADAVSTSKIVDGNVTTIKLADDAVATAKLADAAVTGVKLADGAVTGAKIANDAVGSSELGANAVIEAKIAANAVTGAKIAANAVSTDKIMNDAITADKIAGDSINADKIADLAIQAEHMSDNSVSGSTIQAGVLQESHLAPALAAKVNNTLSRITKDFAPDADCDSALTHANVAAGDFSVGDTVMEGTLWFYTDESDADPANHIHEIYRCVKDDVGAAKWVNTTVDSSELKDLAFTTKSELETTIEIGQDRVTGLTTALGAKANDADVVKKAGPAQSITSEITFTQAIQATAGLVGNVTGNVTGQVSDLGNHLGTLAGAEENKYVDAAELAAKFQAIESDIATKANTLLFGVHPFTADGSTTTFTFGAATDDNQLVTVFVDGVRMRKDTDYSITNDQVTISFALNAGDYVDVERIYRLGN